MTVYKMHRRKVDRRRLQIKRREERRVLLKTKDIQRNYHEYRKV